MRLTFALSLAALSILLPSAHAQRSLDEAAIRAGLARETKGWDQFDAEEVASTFTDDVIWQNPFGVRIQGNKDLLAFLTDLLARPGDRAGKDTAQGRSWIPA